MITGGTHLDTGPGDRPPVGLSGQVDAVWGWRAKIWRHDPGGLGRLPPISSPNVFAPGWPPPETGTACEPCSAHGAVVAMTGGRRQ